MRLSIVVPCYNEEEVLGETVRQLVGVIDKLASEKLVDRESQIYFVDDGSKDRTWAVIESFARSDSRICGIKLSSNRGHQNALLAGLLTAEGDALVTIDADLQDDVELISEMVRHHRAGIDIVYGVREDRRSDSLFKRVTAEGYYRVLALMGVQVVFNHADYRLMSRRSVEALREYREVNLFLRGIIPLLGFKTAAVSYTRARRFAGTSKYPLWKVSALALEGVTSFSATPLRLITGLGFIVCAASLGFTLWALTIRFLTDQSVPGWASTVVPIYFLGGVQLLCIGVIGEYLAKVYMEVKGRPRFTVEQILRPHAISGGVESLAEREHENQMIDTRPNKAPRATAIR